MGQPIQAHELGRFWSKVVRANGCWEWIGSKRPDGYGVFSSGGRNGGMVRSHRVTYELLVGPIPDGLFIDHLCRNRGCVNPAHMEPVTHAENVTRGEAGQHLARQTHCKHGHEFTQGNTIVRDGHRRQCRECANRRMREMRARRAAIRN